MGGASFCFGNALNIITSAVDTKGVDKKKFNKCDFLKFITFLITRPGCQKTSYITDWYNY
jgi:hypothetical protein